MYTFIVCFSLCILNWIAEAQINSRYSEYHLIQRSPAASLSKIGAVSWLAGNSGVTDEGLLSASFSNPGALRVTSVKTSAEFTYKAKTRYFDLIDYDDIFYPSFFSVAYRDEQMSYGISYFNQYSQYLQSYPLSMTTEDQPEGTGDFLQFSTDLDIHSVAGAMQYSLSDNVGIGATIGANYLSHRDEIGRTYSTVNGWSLLAIAGAYAAIDDLSFGASIRYSSPFSIGEVETNAIPLRVMDPFNGVEIKTKYFARLPIVYQIGVSYHMQPSFTISVSDEIQDWSFVHSEYRKISNLHIGISAAASEYLDLLLGYSEQSDAQNGATDLNFLTTGLSLHVNTITFTVGISDSKMFSKTKLLRYSSPPKEPFRQFIVLSAVTYSF